MYKKSNKRKLKGENTKQSIVDTALKLFSEKNFDTVTVEDIVAELGLSVGAFYHHFKNKNAILEHVFLGFDKEYNDFYESVMLTPEIESKRAADKIELFVSAVVEICADIGVDSLPVNFLCPVPGTPMGERSHLAPREALRVLALARLMHPEREIIVCGGRLATLREEQSWVLASGASAIMTGNYLTTRGCGYDDDDALLAALGTLRR